MTDRLLTYPIDPADYAWWDQQPIELRNRLHVAAVELAALAEWDEGRALQTVVHVARVYSNG